MTPRSKVEAQDGSMAVEERSGASGLRNEQPDAEHAAAHEREHARWVAAQYDAMEQANLAQMTAQSAVIREDGAAERLVDQAMADEDRAMRDAELAMCDAG